MAQTITFQRFAVSTEEQQIIVSDVVAGTSAPLTINSSLIFQDPRILVLSSAGDITGITSGIRTALNAKGLVENTNYTLTSKTLTDAYTGATDLDTPYAYNMVIVATNSTARGDTNFGTRLNNFVAAGNHLIMLTFPGFVLFLCTL